MYSRRLAGCAFHLVRGRTGILPRSVRPLFGARGHLQTCNNDLMRACSTSTSRNEPLKRTDHTFSRGRVLEAAIPVNDKGWVEITWQCGLKTQYPYVWLRDNCTCEKCFSSHALARLYLLRDLDVNIKPKAVMVDTDDQTLEITWPDGHKSRYPSAWLEGRSFTEETRTNRQHWLPVPMELWGNKLQDDIPRFEFNKLLEDDQTLFDWITTLQMLGIALLQGVPGRPGQLHRIGERVAFLRKTNYGETFQVKSKAEPSNLAYTPSTLGLHTDLSFYNYTPGMQMLHCVEQVSTEGGDNVFADGFNAAYVLKERNRDLFDILTKTDVDHLDVGTDYIRYFQLSHYPTIRVDAQGKVQQINLSHASRDSVQNLPLEAIAPFYTAIKTFTEIMYEPENHITYKLKQGEIVCLHNYRLLHGRTAYKVTGEGNRHLEGGYIDWDELNSMRRILIMDMDLHENI